jgi:hypothetical protein
MLYYRYYKISNVKMKELIKREDNVTCKVCGKDGERLIFSDDTTQIHHDREWNEKVNAYAIPVHTNG